MNSREEKDGSLRSYPQGSLESPFLAEELFAEESEAEWDTHLAALEAETPFQRAFEQNQTTLIKPEGPEDEFVREGDKPTEYSFPEYLDEPEQDQQFSKGATIHSEMELLSLEEEKDVFKSDHDKSMLAPELLYTEKEDNETEQEEEAFGLAAYGQLREGPVAPPPEDFLQYLKDLVDEEVFDEETQSTRAEWQIHPTIHVHFAGKSPEERFAEYVKIRPLYQQSMGINNPAQWIAKNIITLTFFGRRTPCHCDLRKPLADAENALRKQAFNPAIDSFWGFVPRTMRTRNKLSNHALGRAIDINFRTNPHIYKNEDILVIRETTGMDLGRKQMHDAMRRASQRFQQIFNQQWADQQTGKVREAIEKRREALDTYARAGLLNLEQPLIDALLNAGLIWGGDWQSEKDFMHFELPLSRRITPTVPSAAVRQALGVGKPSAELVRFAQRVLNAAEGDQLAVDGNLGPLTRGALECFRRKYDLGAGGVLDEKTQLALTQRALEELAQQSIFMKGKRDTAINNALSEFKSQHRLGTEPTLDAATCAALADALELRAALPGKTPVKMLVD
jgi:hypothetical protein